MMLALLVRCATVTMMLVDALITAVCDAAGFFLQGQAARLEEGKVMRFAAAKGSGQQPLGAALHYNLGFAGVALLLATVVLLLFF